MAHAGGRPKIVIDYQAVEKLAFMHCTQEEIASFLGISTKTLQRNAEFCRIYLKGKENGRASLRRYQWESVKKGNIAMQIWLGKQLLGQVDRQEITGKDGGPIKQEQTINWANVPDVELEAAVKEVERLLLK